MKKHWRKWLALAILVVITVVLWDELNDFGREIYNAFK